MNNYFLLSIIPLLIYLFLKMKKSFHMLQQNWYNDGNRYLNWILNNAFNTFLTIEVITIVFAFIPVKYIIYIFVINLNC